MSNMEIASLVASVVSVIIALLAIYLSVTFYKMSTRISQDVKEKTDEIETSVDKLETISNMLYRDILSIMKETVSDIREHAWPDTTPAADISEMIEQKADEKLEKFRGEIKGEMKNELAGITKRTKMTNTKMEELQKSMQQFLDRAIDESRRVEKEVFAEIVADKVLKSLQRVSKLVDRIKAEIVVEELPEFDLEDIREGIIQLRNEGLIELPGYIRSGKDIMPETIIELK